MGDAERSDKTNLAVYLQRISYYDNNDLRQNQKPCFNASKKLLIKVTDIFIYKGRLESNENFQYSF